MALENLRSSNDYKNATKEEQQRMVNEETLEILKSSSEYQNATKEHQAELDQDYAQKLKMIDALVQQGYDRKTAMYRVMSGGGATTSEYKD
jgi:4-diphosphocytidyl-2C-methyl-D-erythritol kinase